jgi:hypothetical protein
MISDLAILLRLKWRAFQRKAQYWLLIAYNPVDRSPTNRLYAVYLVVAAVVWLVVVWAYAVEQSANLGLALDPAMRAGLIGVIPPAVVLIQAIILVRAIRSSPLKLSARDARYLATSPASRAAVVLIRFVAGALPWMTIGGVVGAWTAMTLAWPLGDVMAGRAGLQALLLTPVLSLLWVGGAWLVGILRYCWRGSRPGLWIAQGMASVLLSGAMLGPGRAWQALVLAESAPLHWAGMAGFALMVIGGLLAVGRGANLIAVTEESYTFSRLEALGPFAPADLVSSIKKQAQLAKRGPRFHLLPADGLPVTLMARSGLLALRGSFRWLSWFFWGAFMAQIIVLLVRLEASDSLQAWTGLLLLMMLYPPRNALEVFQADMRDAFLRQVIPTHNLALLAWDTALSLPLIWLGAVITWSVQMPFVTAIVLGGIAFGLMTSLVALCLALDYVHLRASLVERVSYEQAVVVGFGLPLIVGVVTGSSVAALLAGGAVVAWFASLVRHSGIRVA